MSNLYLISQNVNDMYDTFDSAVVVAGNEEAAKLIHPGRCQWPDSEIFDMSEWTASDNVQVKLIGTAARGFKVGTVICASYNAG
jgi:hypothetical protein